jgi:hypothetical protein
MQLMNTAVPETADLLSSACVCVCAINFLSNYAVFNYRRMSLQKYFATKLRLNFALTKMPVFLVNRDVDDA